MSEGAARALVDDLFRQSAGQLVAALVRLLGPAHVTLAEDVVHDALVSALHAWRLELPASPKAWILQVAKHRAIDLLRRERRLSAFPGEPDAALAGAVDAALSPEADAENQLAMMFAICDDALAPETHVTLILRLLSGLSAPEIARAFLVDVQTIDRRLHGGRARLQELGALPYVRTDADLRARQPSIEHALYLLFNEGYHGNATDSPLHPALCADAIRFAELLLGAAAVEPSTVHALGALFCFGAARLGTRLDAEGVVVPLAEQARTRWDPRLIERGILHLGASATGPSWTRWHLEAGIAFEHTRAASVAETDWDKIVAYYDALLAISPGPVVALNRGLAIAERHGLAAGRAALATLADADRLAAYSFYWAARADIERRSGHPAEARAFYARAAGLAKSPAERLSYERRLRELDA